jgi:DNA-binding MarR family transcriptional regulator
MRGGAQARQQPGTGSRTTGPASTETASPELPSTELPSTETASPELPSTELPSTGQLNSQIEACVVELTGRIFSQVERIAERLSVPAIFIKALHTLDAPMAMKDLGKRMHCDPSFVTAIADMLEKRGLARRTAHPGDRRVKHLILTSEGCDLRQRLEAEISARMPWSNGLTDAERVQLLALIRKMLNATPPAGSPAPAREVEASLGAAPAAG